MDDYTNTPPTYGGVTPLHLAAISGNLRAVTCLHGNGACVNLSTDLGDSPLFEACFEGHVGVVSYLVEEAGGDFDVCNQRGASCLMIAAYNDKPDVIKYVIDHSDVIDHVDKDWRNALFYAVASGRLDTVLYLVDQGVKVVPDYQRTNLLMEAVLQNQSEIVEYLAQYSHLVDLDVDELDQAGRNVLFYLMDHGTTEMLELLLTLGVSIEPANDGRTLLMSAALKGNDVLIRYLVEHADKLGLNLNEKDERGRNCLFYCITGSTTDMLEFLINNGVNVENTTDDVTLIMQAVAKNRPEMLVSLIHNVEELDYDVNSRDKDGWNALLYAAASGHLHLFKILAANGAQCHPAVDGRTVLMQAASKGDVSMLRYVLDYNQFFVVYLHQRDEDGWNALFYSIQGTSTPGGGDPKTKMNEHMWAEICSRMRHLRPQISKFSGGTL